MYYKLNDNELEKINNASKITMTDYELLGNFVPVESMIAIIEDLLCEVGKLEEKYEDLERDLEDNYKPYTREELYGVSDKDFM